jgi:hypothetical protein
MRWFLFVDGQPVCPYETFDAATSALFTHYVVPRDRCNIASWWFSSQVDSNGVIDFFGSDMPMRDVTPDEVAAAGVRPPCGPLYRTDDWVVRERYASFPAGRIRSAQIIREDRVRRTVSADISRWLPAAADSVACS